MKNWSKMYLIDPIDMDHLLGELKLNGFNAYDPDPDSKLPYAKIQVEEPNNVGMGGFLFTKDTSWIGGYPFHVRGERLDAFMQQYQPPSAHDSSQPVAAQAEG